MKAGFLKRRIIKKRSIFEWMHLMKYILFENRCKMQNMKPIKSRNITKRLPETQILFPLLVDQTF